MNQEQHHEEDELGNPVKVHEMEQPVVSPAEALEDLNRITQEQREVEELHEELKRNRGIAVSDEEHEEAVRRHEEKA